MTSRRRNLLLSAIFTASGTKLTRERHDSADKIVPEFRFPAWAEAEILCGHAQEQLRATHNEENDAYKITMKVTNGIHVITSAENETQMRPNEPCLSFLLRKSPFGTIPAKRSPKKSLITDFITAGENLNGGLSFRIIFAVALTLSKGHIRAFTTVGLLGAKLGRSVVRNESTISHARSEPP
jgi:hypothetical protein